MALLRIALLNIARRRLRTSLTVCGVALGIAGLAVVQKTFVNTTGRRFRGDEPEVMLGEMLATTLDKKAGERAHNNQFVSFARSIAWGTSLIALLVGTLGIGNTMAMPVFERTKEIGILRALGWRRWRPMLLIQMEAAALGSIGGLAGLAAGWGALHLLAARPMTANIASGSISLPHAASALAIAVIIGLAAG
jgi:ABC-type antimicrobial peptide transport system permease subunit